MRVSGAYAAWLALPIEGSQGAGLAGSSLSFAFYDMSIYGMASTIAAVVGFTRAQCVCRWRLLGQHGHEVLLAEAYRAYRTPTPTRVRSTLCLCASVPVLWCAAASRCIAHGGARWRGVTVVRCCARFSLLAALAVLVGRLLLIPLRLSGVAHAHCCGNGCAAAHCGPLERERDHRGSRPEATGPRPLWWVVEVRARAERCAARRAAHINIIHVTEHDMTRYTYAQMTVPDEATVALLKAENECTRRPFVFSVGVRLAVEKIQIEQSATVSILPFGAKQTTRPTANATFMALSRRVLVLVVQGRESDELTLISWTAEVYTPVPRC